MEVTIAEITLFIIDCGYRILCPVYHFLLSVEYWSRGKTVPPVKNPILLMSATELAKRIREGTLTSKTVVQTFIQRIAEVEPYINAIVEQRFKDAIGEAEKADNIIASGTFTKQQLAEQKPLLGVPFTVKLLLTVKGMKCTAGSLLFKDVRAQEDASTVAMMKEAGGIVLATTNTPEMGLNLESTNYVHGTTCNPYDTSRTSGGSSGGESAIISAAGSVIGLGNDMAGSVRMPAMFTGIFAHKPSRGLVPNAGSFPVVAGKAERLLYTGPMCRYATDLVTCMRILSSNSEKKLKFGEEVDFRGIKIYYIKSFGKMTIVPKVDSEIQDAVVKVASYFEKKYGSAVKKAVIPLFKRSNNIFVHSLFSSISSITEIVAGRVELDEFLEFLKFLVRRSVFTFGAILAFNAPRIPFLYDAKYVKLYSKLEEELDDQLNKLLDDRSVLILPTLPFPAPYRNEIGLLVPGSCYTSIFDVLGLPATQCPVGLNKNRLPIGIQIVSRIGNDALTIACAKELEKAFGGWLPPKSKT